ncbi:ABC transporter substrate-binding protein [Kiritimatiellaeota bacterium B1221]|nr:ABC transporter substrate-binding protein [Kiritimatiellaeota bacterium B1221]
MKILKKLRTFGNVAGLPAAFLFIFSACGQPVPESEESATESVSLRTITDAAGRTVEIPSNPTRVIALSEADLDALLALGLKPVGACAGRGQDGFPRYLEGKTEGIPLLGALYRPSFDRVIQAEPDLILLGGWADEGLAAQLEEVAPVVVTYGGEDTWKSLLARLGDLLGREEQASAFLAGYQKELANAQARLGDRNGATVSVVRWNPRGPMFMLDGSFSRQVLKELGLKTPEAQQLEGVAHSPVLSFEELHLIDADHVFIGTLATEGEARTAMDSAMETPAFQQLPAFRAGAVSEVDGSLWTSVGGPLAAMQVLQDTANALSK